MPLPWKFSIKGSSVEANSSPRVLQPRPQHSTYIFQGRYEFSVTDNCPVADYVRGLGESECSPGATELAEFKSLESEAKMSIWTILFVILLIAWICGFAVFHVAGALIHLLLIFAVISLILHFLMGRRAA